MILAAALFAVGLPQADAAPKKGKKAKSSKSESSSSPKYADFSAEDALMAALKRSYGEDSDEGEEE